jgi:hypothetical protein
LGWSSPSSASTTQHTVTITRDVTVIIDGPSSSSTARYSKVANFQFQLRLSQQDSNQFAHSMGAPEVGCKPGEHWNEL